MMNKLDSIEDAAVEKLGIQAPKLVLKFPLNMLMNDRPEPLEYDNVIKYLAMFKVKPAVARNISAREMLQNIWLTGTKRALKSLMVNHYADGNPDGREDKIEYILNNMSKKYKEGDELE